MTTGENGIVKKTEEARDKTLNQQVYSETKLNELYAGMINSEAGTGGPVELNGIKINSVVVPDSEITTNSIAVYVNASADNGIAKIEYSKDGGVNYITDTNQTTTSYTFSGLTENTTYQIRVKITDTKGNIAIYPNNIAVTTKQLAAEVTISDIFQKEREDEAGYDPKKLHVGDFINYDAGTWTAQEISAIKTGEKGSEVTANGTRSLPNTAYQFGGFAAGDSRNGNAVPHNNDYSATSQGWRIFDVADDGTVTLISAGNPEGYYHKNRSYSEGYNSEYILTGVANSYASSSTFIARNWSMYVNSSQYAISATSLTKTRLEQWYDRYMGTSGANVYTYETFQLIYNKKYESLIDNYTYFWLSSAYPSGTNNMCCVTPYDKQTSNWFNVGFGVRPLVSLRSDAKVDLTPGTQSVTSRGNIYTYNSWTIK